ncbi:spore coat protein GerQ [Ureibacillus manganicus]|uniref:spore coat protein GerQ n=1 Tax=Ureibacillus manganicus TaxID=1266064 RepID=UPI00068B7F53|nr:spore coat protein GerQ [Ureibacillus manganicus]
MAYYYWNPSNQQQPYSPYTQFQSQNQSPTQSQQMMPPTYSGGALFTPAGGAGIPAAAIRGEESYIENILRLNRGKEAVFSFTIPSATGTEEAGNTILVRGAVVEAGRDHAVIHEFGTDHYFLFPMIYFDYARFEEPITYLRGGSVVNSNPRQ